MEISGIILTYILNIPLLLCNILTISHGAGEGNRTLVTNQYFLSPLKPHKMDVCVPNARLFSACAKKSKFGNKLGLYAGPAALFVRCVIRFKSTITI